MQRQGRLQLDTSLFLRRSTALLSLDDGRGSLTPPALYALAPYPLVRADARAPTLLALVPSALMRADVLLLLLLLLLLLAHGHMGADVETRGMSLTRQVTINVPAGSLEA